MSDDYTLSQEDQVREDLMASAREGLGSTTCSRTITIPRALQKRIKKQAKLDKVTPAEWLKEALEAALGNDVTVTIIPENAERSHPTKEG